MFSVFVGDGPLGLLGFLWVPFPLVVLSCIGFFLVAPMFAAHRCGGYGPQGAWGPGVRPVRARGRNFWLLAIIVGVIWVVNRRTPPPAPVVPVAVERQHRWSQMERGRARVDETDSQFESRLERGATVDRAADRSATQIERQLNRGVAQIERQLEHTVTQIERQLDHVERQISGGRRTSIPAVVIAQVADDAPIIEPDPPALPNLGPPAPEIPFEAAPGATNPEAQASTTTTSAPAPVAASPAATNPSANAESQSEKPPKWTETEILDAGNRKLMVVKSGFAGSQKEAEHDALEASRLVVGAAIQRAYPNVGHWIPSAEAVREDAVRLTYVEPIHRKLVSTGTPYVVYRAYQQVELSPAVYTRLVSNWKAEIVPRRLEVLGGLAALLTLTFATGAAYFRVDERTHGRYRGWLKIAAVPFLVGGAVAAAALIYIARI